MKKIVKALRQKQNIAQTVLGEEKVERLVSLTFSHIIH